MVVGDAGGFTNPMFFGGIGIAMLTGMIAGETAVEALEEDNYSADKLISYSQKVNELPIAAPNLIRAHNLFYHQCNNKDLANIGILTDNQDITHLTWGKKIIVFGRTLRRPRIWGGISKISKIMEGFRLSRDWGF